MPEAVDLSFAFGLAPEKAVAYFESKGYALNWDWWETWQEAHSKAFTVAKVTKMDILQDIRAAVGKSIKEGGTLAQFNRELEPKLKAAGWWGRQKVIGPDGVEKTVTLGSPWRLMNIRRTNIQTAYAAGRWQQFAENADNRPYMEFVAVLDARTRPSHRAMDGKVFRIDDPIWDTHSPPLDWGCRCRLRARSEADLKDLGLKVESSEGTLSTEDRLVSEATGELRPVTVYTNPKTGQKVSTGVGWDYNPGKTEFKPDLAKYDKDIAKEYEKEIVTEGLAKRFPIKKNDDLNPLLKAFDKENPGIFQQGFSSIKVKPTKSFLMSAYQSGDLIVSSSTQGSGLNPAKNLKDALKKITKGEDLSFNEEYAVEALWHEIGHCRSKGWEPNWQMGKQTIIVMEMLNQWVARQTYPEFLEKLGGKAVNQDEILKKGPGYSSMIRNFRSLLARAGIDEGTALALLRPLSVESKWSDLPFQIPEKLAALMEDPSLAEKIKKALAYVGSAYREEEFTRVLTQIFGEAT